MSRIRWNESLKSTKLPEENKVGTHSDYFYVALLLHLMLRNLICYLVLNPILGEEKSLGGHIARTADPSWSEILLSNEVLLSITSSEKFGERWHLSLRWRVCGATPVCPKNLLTRKCLCALRSYFPESAWTLPTGGK